MNILVSIIKKGNVIMNYDYLWEYFVYYQMTENNKKKKKIMDAFLEYIYYG